MIVLKKVTNYLKYKNKKYKRLSTFFQVISTIGLVISFIFLGYLWWLVIPFLLLGGISTYYKIKSKNYSYGTEGEREVAKTLYENLNDNYYLLNDVKLPNSQSNIDHIILGPNGVFIIETKNNIGQIFCKEDYWYKYDERDNNYYILPGNPSKRIKGKSADFGRFIEKILNRKVWINRFIVFANNKVTLNLDNPSVDVLKINELVNYIKSMKSFNPLSKEEINKIAQVLRKS